MCGTARWDVALLERPGTHYDPNDGGGPGEATDVDIQNATRDVMGRGWAPP